ncbi:MAG: ATP-binding protein [Chthoniobacterales bacterium]
MKRRHQLLAKDGIYIVLALALASFSAIAAIGVTRHLVQQFQSVQQKASIAYVNHALQALTLASHGLLRTVSTFSYWEEACNYINGQNPAFLEKNFNSVLLEYDAIDVVMVFDQQKQYVGGVYAGEDHQPQPVPQKHVQNILSAKTFLEIEDIRTGRTGFVIADDGVYLLAVRPVAQSRTQQARMGSLILGRRLGKKELEALSELTGMRVKLHMSGDPVLANPDQTFESPLLNGCTILLAQGNDIHGERDATVVLEDIFGKKSFQLDMKLPQEIESTARDVSHTMQKFLIGIGTLLGLFVALTIFELQKRRKEIANRIRIQQELEEAKRKAEVLANNAHLANKEKGDFLAIMSHEIRTPLNAILGFSELLEHENLDPVALSYTKSIRGGGQLLIRVINDILDFSKIEAGRVELDYTVENIRTLVQEVIHLFDSLAQEKENALQVDVADDVPEFILIDAIRLRQVLGNLLSNAVKFTQRGRIHLGVAREEVSIDNPVEITDLILLRFTVEDDGIGIPPEKRHKLFQFYSQVDATTTRQYGGTGLGLAICKRLTQLMGGEIELLDSEKGSHFSFFLPVQIMDAPSPEASAHSETPPVPHAAPAGNVLIVEDNKVNARLLLTILKRLGITAFHAASGNEALKMASENDFSLIFMDVQMGEINGFETTRLYRSAEKQKGVAPATIIAVTASIAAEDRDDCFAAGMNDFLSKPYTSSQIQQIIEKYLYRR